MEDTCVLDSHLNDADVLDDTPIGTLRVIDWGGNAAVAVMDQHDLERPARIIHMLEPGENPLNAIYGKRTFENPRIVEAYKRQHELRLARIKSWKKDHRKDTRKAVMKFLNKHGPDGRAAIAAYLGAARAQ